MTFEQAVEKIQGIMKDVEAEKLNTIGDVAVQVNLTDDDCSGIMYIAISNNEVDVQGYDYKDNDAVINISCGDLSKILKGSCKVATIVSKGALTIDGNADAVDSLFACAKKKPAPKKVEVKPVAKKACCGSKCSTKKTTDDAAAVSAAKSVAKVAPKATKTTKAK